MIKKLLFSLFSLSMFVTNAQEVDRGQVDYAYIDAISVYTRLANKGYQSESTLLKLGNANYFSANYPEAAKWYQKLLELNTKVDPEIYFRYSNTLKSVGDFEMANEYLNKFLELNESDSRAIKFKNNPNYLSDIEKYKDKYTVSKLNFNSSFSDFGVSFWNDQLIFVSNRPKVSSDPSKIKKEKTSFSSLFTFNDGKVDDFLDLQSEFNISLPVFTKDKKTVYFTQSNINKKKRGYSKDFVTHLKIYKANYIDGSWKNVTELPFNSNEFSCAHPALSPDEKTLYFVSSMPGTIGDTDIFKVEIFNDGTYGSPVNIGDNINTEGKESFPFVSHDNLLYFASDGQLGLGGLDIFKFDLNDENAVVINLGEPINSPFDDFYISFNQDNSIGYLSSNRLNGVGFDDIYKISDIYIAPKPPAYFQSFSGFITDKYSNEYITQAKVSLFDANFNLLSEVFSNLDGSYALPKYFGNIGDIVYLKVEHADFITDEKRTFLPDTIGDSKVNFRLDKRILEVSKGDDLAKVFEIENVIYFDYDKFDIRSDAEVELAKVYEVLSEYPKMKIDIRSYTDSRGKKEYNRRLSEQRAKGTINWLIEKGIDPTRLSGKGYGESVLVNDCSDDVDCTEEQHQMNRRSEFIIIDL